jgi:GNAT superfamily N-acetyltransferase
MNIAIRAAQAQDWELMRDIFVQAGKAAWSHILTSAALAELSAPDRWDPRDGADVLVAEFAGKVVGFVCFRASADEDAESAIGEIDGFYVTPSMWSRGVGQTLLAAGLDRLAASGFREATLWTEHRNHRPLQFYRAAGWKPDGRERRRTYRGTELLEIRHRLTLTGRPTPRT